MLISDALSNLCTSINTSSDQLVRNGSFPHNSCYAIKQAFSAFFKTEDFIVGGILGSGYFATVVLVKHRPSDRFMALKISHDSFSLSKELDLLKRLSHQNVLSYYGACVVGGRLSCALEFAEMGSLANLLSDSQLHLTWTDRISLCLDIAKGLHNLHSLSLIHRDLSSQNILIRLSRGRSDSESHSRILDALYNTKKWPSLDKICHESFCLSPFNIASLNSASFESKCSPYFFN
ncbi:Dual specificity testis-specific protein kinase 2 [Cichlidogyrus casuarinus]|uniref:dual-specificity kinase n=1 Tax=Cichlidogyrus casuarinus TaxID=1844966 RepID=A0ABD2QJH5_9PLAT